MRRVLFFAALMALSFAAPALAGQVSYADGRGKWAPTGCALPPSPAALAKDPETRANDLNARVAQHNAFVAAVQEYMNCVNKEAERDMSATNEVITRSAQALMEKADIEVKESAQLVQKK